MILEKPKIFQQWISWKMFSSYTFIFTKPTYKIFLDINSFAAPNGPLLASSKSCKSCSRRCLEVIHSHLNWPNADATTRSSQLLDNVAKVEMTKLRGTLWGKTGRIWPLYLRRTETRITKAPTLKKNDQELPQPPINEQVLNASPDL